MGSGASLPRKLDKSTVKLFSGVHFDETTFQSLQRKGCITRTQYLKLVTKNYERLHNKYSEVVEASTKSVWEPLPRSNFYKIILDPENGAYTKYDSSSTDERRKLLHESCNLCFVTLSALYCEKGCQRSFSDGCVCDGSIMGPGIHPSKYDSVDVKEVIDENRALWSDFGTSNPDDVAVHLWTFSLAGARHSTDSQTSDTSSKARSIPDHHDKPLFQRLNIAVLHDDPKLLASMAYIISGIIRWIRHNKFIPESDIVLYRAKPISDTLTASYSEEGIQSTTGKLSRMPLFIACSQSLQTARHFTSIRSNGVAGPIIEFVLPKGQACDFAACLKPISHFPDEKEWLLSPYSAVEYRSQRLEYLEVGHHSQLKLVLIVQYVILPDESSFLKFEPAGFNIKTAVVPCQSQQNSVIEKMQDHKKVMPLEDDRLPVEFYSESESLGSAYSYAQSYQSESRTGYISSRCVYDTSLYFAESNVQSKMNRISIKSDKDYATQLYSETKKEIQYEAVMKQQKLAEVQGLTLTEVKVNAAVDKANDELDIQKCKVNSVKSEICAVSSQIKYSDQLIFSINAKVNSISQEILNRKRDMSSLQTDKEAVTSLIEECKEKLEPVLAAEREAFSRWEACEQAADTSVAMSFLSWEEKLTCVERARREYIDAALPSKEIKILNNRVRTLEADIELITQHVAKLERDIEVLNAECQVLNKLIEKYNRVLKSLERKLIEENKEHDVVAFKLEEMKAEREAIHRQLQESVGDMMHYTRCDKELWQDLDSNVSELLKPAVRPVGAQELKSTVESLSIAVVCFCTNWSTPCFLIKGTFNDAARVNPTIKFLSVDVDDASDAALQHSITKLPTFLIFKSGKEVERMVSPSIDYFYETIQHYSDTT